MLAGTIPLYQIAVHVAVAGMVLLIVIYAPLLGRRLPGWATLLLTMVGLALIGSAVFAGAFGNWPFQSALQHTQQSPV